LLARLDRDDDRADLDRLGLESIGIAVVSLYPFEAAALSRDASPAEVREEIDIGGVAIMRAAAKNDEHVAVVADPADYPEVIRELDRGGGVLDRAARARLAAKAFALAARYDSCIAAWSGRAAGAGAGARAAGGGGDFPEVFTPVYEKVRDLRYGENPHQRAAFYREAFSGDAPIPRARQLAGKELSYNNIMDADGAVATVRDFQDPTVVIVKHANPCGLASAATIEEAFDSALACDPMSAFGGIIGANRTVTEAMARRIVAAKLFVEIIAAPEFEAGAVSALARRTDLRLLELPGPAAARAAGGWFDDWEVRGVAGGLLVQTRDTLALPAESLAIVSERRPTGEEMAELAFAFRVVKGVKSNAIVLTQGRRTVGIGAGQMSRVDSVRLAAAKAGDRARGSMLASDAFFPFPDGIEEAARAGVAAVIQPGGSKGDAAVIDAANRLGLAMVFTGQRHFRH
jgi:phosphoribosylaminoimidazolecarboxamide formyltransferase/IMP cyclohydrolase